MSTNLSQEISIKCMNVNEQKFSFLLKLKEETFLSPKLKQK
jgi:hypothetical protein